MAIAAMCIFGTLPATAGVQSLELPNGTTARITTADDSSIDLKAWPMLKVIGQTMVEAYGACVVITPQPGQPRAVPMKTDAEWNSFLSATKGRSDVSGC
ncbi:MAG: hypothetical protein RLO06_10365 [Parvibaculum sp.]